MNLRIVHTAALAAALVSTSAFALSFQGSNTATYEKPEATPSAPASLGERRRPAMNPGGSAVGGAPVVVAPGASAKNTGWADENVSAAPAAPQASGDPRKGWADQSNNWSGQQMAPAESSGPAGWADKPMFSGSSAPAAPAPARFAPPSAAEASGSGMERRRPALNDAAAGAVPMAASATAPIAPVQSGDAYPNLATVPPAVKPTKTVAKARTEIRALEADRQQSMSTQEPPMAPAIIETKPIHPAPMQAPAQLPTPQAVAVDAPAPAPSAQARELPPIELKAPPPPSSGGDNIPVTFSDERTPKPQSAGAIPVGEAIPAAQAAEVKPQQFDVQEKPVAGVEPIQLIPPQGASGVGVEEGAAQPVAMPVRRLLPESRYAAIRRASRR